MAETASTYVGEQRRRSTRLEQTWPVIIRGIDLLGQPFEERTATQNLSLQGCRYASKHHLPKNTWLTLEVPSGDSRKEAACVRARVAWIQRPRSLRDLFQVGVETEKPINIWNVAFSPNDWNSEASGEILPAAFNPGGTEGESAKELSLEDYLQMASAHRAMGAGTARKQNAEDHAAFEQVRQELPQETQAGGEALARTGEPQDRASESQHSAEKAFYERWIGALERDKNGAKAEIACAVSEEVAAQLTAFERDLKETLASEWNEKVSQAQREPSKWESDAKALRDEIRASAEASAVQTGELLNEKFAALRRELEESLKTTAAANAAKEGNSADARGADGETRHKFSGEMESARRELDELLEASLDNAAQRLAERISEGSRELLRKTESELASRVAELQKESGITLETSRAALDELKTSLAEVVSKAKQSLEGIEHAAANYSENSRQIEAESRQSMDVARQRMAAASDEQCVEMEKRMAQVEKEAFERLGNALEQRVREAAKRSTEEIESKAAAAEARAAKAAEELDARQEQAENIVQVHRERLRQASEQMQREFRSSAEGMLAEMQNELGATRAEALKRWMEDLSASGAAVTLDAAGALRNEAHSQLEKAGTLLSERAQQALGSANQHIQGALEEFRGKVRSAMEEAESSEREKARRSFAGAASEELEAVNREFTKAAKAAAVALGEMIGERTETTLTEFSSALERNSAEGRAKLAEAGEEVLHHVQAHAQTSFEHFQEQLAVKSEQAARDTDEAAGHQLETRIEKFREQGDLIIEEWSAKQQGRSERALETNQERMQAAAQTAIESMLEQLEHRTDERINLATCATERAVRQACADVFDAVAQKMREQLQGIAEMRHPSPGGMSQGEHRASA